MLNVVSFIDKFIRLLGYDTQECMHKPKEEERKENKKNDGIEEP